MKASEIRQRYLNFFAENGHELVRSASLIPHNDPTLFFVNAGMVPFKDVFTGKEQRAYSRATSVQKCLRVSGKHNDLENVGRTPRHHTLFEMLGNFSFGDYFKKEACEMAWRFLTEDLKIPKERLWVTVFEEDDEAWDIWRTIGFPESRLQRLDAKENFWSMGDTGPCGPCTEIFFDHGDRVSSDLRGPAGGDDRYVEIWNLVFMQYDQRADGSRIGLPKPSIDTGSGLERVAAALQGVTSNYDTDLFQGLIQTAAGLFGTPYGKNDEVDTAMRVIADHARAASFLIADGVMPSNEARGYVLRRIMRRAIRFGVKSGLDKPFFHEVTQRVIQDFGTAYPELQERANFIGEVVQGEEDRFRTTLDRGMKLLDSELARVGSGGQIPGSIAFTLSDTFGFPLDLTRLIAEEQNIGVDEAGFEQAMEDQRARGRAAWKGSGETAVAELWSQLAEEKGQTIFTGYPTETLSGTEGVGQVAALYETSKDGENVARVESLSEGQHGILVLDQTPFYGESGGQQGDTGLVTGEGFVFEVHDTTKATGLHLHHGILKTGAIALGQSVGSQVTGTRRDNIRRNHTATHLLHAALREHLGEHVTQKGSLVGPDRLRFDFSHHKAMTAQGVKDIEAMVNTQIMRNVTSYQRNGYRCCEEAGAMALFGEKYDDVVRVVSIPGFSVELCGGTHVPATGFIGPFVITSEAGIAAGVRRIEAQTGPGALQWLGTQRTLIDESAALLKTNAAGLVDSIQKLQTERKAAEKALDKMKRELAKEAAGSLVNDARDIGGVKVLATTFDGDPKEQADRFLDQLNESVKPATQRGLKR